MQVNYCTVFNGSLTFGFGEAKAKTVIMTVRFIRVHSLIIHDKKEGQKSEVLNILGILEHQKMHQRENWSTYFPILLVFYE